MKTMKKIMMLVLTASVFMFTACDPKEVKDTTVTTPELGVDFAVTVNGQEVTFSYTGTATSVRWYYGADRDAALAITPLTGKEVKTTINIKGEYVAICAASNGGDYAYSASAPFAIEVSDLSYLQSGIWKALSGGKEGYNVVFKLDAGTQDNQASAYFHKPLDFWGDRTAGAEDGAAWGPWGGSSIFDWGGEPEVGTISFDCVNMTYRLVLTDGVKYNTVVVKDGDAEVQNGTFEGTFSLNPITRDMSETLTGGDGVSVDKWATIFNANYSEVVDLDANPEWASISFDENGRFPMDKGRVGEGMFTTNDLRNLEIFYADDKGLVINIKRTYDGWEDDNSTKKAASCWLVYNYIIEGVNYEPKAENTVTIDESVTASSLVGSWNLATDVATFGWIDWGANEIFDVFTDFSSALNTVKDWWMFGDPANADGQINAAIASAANTILTFNNDGTCTIVDALYSYADDAYTPATYNTTYSVTNGVITFGEEVTISAAGINLQSTEMYFMAPLNSNGGAGNIWIAISADGKEESNGIQLTPVVE